MESKYDESLTAYERELDDANDLGLKVHERYPFKSRLKGLIYDRDIYLSDAVVTEAQKQAVLEEEIQHFRRDSGNIVDQKQLIARRREKRTRKQVALNLVPVRTLLDTAIRLKESLSLYALSLELDTEEKVIEDAIFYYGKMYPDPVEYRGYLICFDPLRINELEGAPDERN